MKCFVLLTVGFGMNLSFCVKYYEPSYVLIKVLYHGITEIFDSNLSLKRL